MPESSVEPFHNLDTPGYIQSILTSTDVSVNQETLDLIHQFYTLTMDWNNRMSLIAPCDLSYWVVNHLIDSIYPPMMETTRHLFPQQATYLDFGSGGGYPGIPLALIHSLSVTLCDVNQKKLRFLHEASNILHNRPIPIVDGNAKKEKRYDVLLSRAVGTMELLIKQTKPYRHKNTRLLLWKGKLDKTLMEWESCKAPIKKDFEIQIIPYLLPIQHKERSLVILSPVSV